MNSKLERSVVLFLQERVHICSKNEINSSVLDSSDEFECMGPHNDTTNCSSIASYDISNSCLIKSPLVFELLNSHGLLEENGNSEEKPKCNSDSESKICSIEDNNGPPSFLQVYSLQPRIEQNKTNDEEKGVYKCGWKSCDMQFSYIKELAQHVNDTHICQDENSFYRCNWNGCVRQGKAINARYRMLIHVRTHTDEKPHTCDICGKKFSRVENLRIHERSHTGEKPYICPIAGCYKAYTNSSDRFKHLKTHQDNKPYVCRVEGCDKRYTDPSSLRKHMKSNAHGKDNGQKPNLTSQVTGIENNIQNNSDSNSEHLNRSPLKKSSTSELTGIEIDDVQNNSNSNCKNSHSSLLNKSATEISKTKPYACKVEGCNKRYTDPSSLRKHMKSNFHSSPTLEIRNYNKPYACKVEGCNKSYTDPSSLRKHQRVTSHGRDTNTIKGKAGISKIIGNKNRCS